MKILPLEGTPRNFNGALKVQDRPQRVPPLSVGEVVEAEILENQHSGTVTVLLKNKRNTVQCNLPLKKGDKVAVKVSQLHPKVILRIVPDGLFLTSGLMNCLRFFRTHPRMLSSFFKEATAIFNPHNLGEIESFMGRDDIQRIMDMVTSLIFSRKSVQNPLFLKNFIHQFGYLFEKELSDALNHKSGRPLSIKNAGQTLKAVLLKLSGRLEAQSANVNFPAAEKLSEFVKFALTAIETHQGLNYMLQEREGKYLFQIPIMFPENMGMAEIFVKFADRESQGKRDQERKSVLICLDMDALGRIVVDTVIEKKKMGCTLKCNDQNVADFITPFLVKLAQKLEALGYKLDHLKCTVEKDNLQTEHAFEQMRPLFTQDKVDVMV